MRRHRAVAAQVLPCNTLVLHGFARNYWYKDHRFFIFGGFMNYWQSAVRSLVTMVVLWKLLESNIGSSLLVQYPELNPLHDPIIFGLVIGAAIELIYPMLVPAWNAISPVKGDNIVESELLVIASTVIGVTIYGLALCGLSAEHAASFAAIVMLAAIPASLVGGVLKLFFPPEESSA